MADVQQPQGGAPAGGTQPAPGTPEHDAAMAAKADAAGVQVSTHGIQQGSQQFGQNQQQGDPQRPKWLDAKFKTPEDLAAAYTELEKKLGAQQPKTTTVDQSNASGDSNQGQPQGINMDALVEEWESNQGSLTAATLEAMKAKGLEPHMVKAMVKGAVAEASEAYQAVVQEAGGEEKYATMLAWAKQNLSPAEAQSYNKMIASDDPFQRKVAVQGLVSRYVASNGTEGGSVINGAANGGGGDGAAVEGFRSFREQVSAQKDPRYRTDPAYREQVERRIANSKY